MTITLNTAALAAPIVTGVGACVVEALGQTPAGAPTRQCLLIPGRDIPHDDCDCGGQFAQAVRTVYGSNTFPTPYGATWIKCAPLLTVVEVVASITRCTPGMGNTTQGDMPPPPTCADLLEAAVQQDYDRAAVRQGIACCLEALADPRTNPRLVHDWALGQTIVLPDQGQCSGSETTYYIALGRCGC